MAYFYEAYILDKMKKPDESLEKYLEAVKVDPSLAVAYHNIGLILVEKKMYEKAIENYKKSI
jgi:tetratricopeptide (TPR) repeat protein